MRRKADHLDQPRSARCINGGLIETLSRVRSSELAWSFFAWILPRSQRKFAIARILARLGLDSAFGAAIAAGLFLIGVPNPLLWGILSRLLRFVPYIGPLSRLGLPIALATALDPGWSMAVWTAML